MFLQLANVIQKKTFMVTFDTSIIRPHRSTIYIDAAYCYRNSSVVCLSVCLSWS